MPSVPFGLRRMGVAFAALALVAVGAGSTLAASNPATLYACYDVYGNVKMSDTAQCKLAGGGRLVSWSTVGVPGPTGPVGPTGPTGPTGPAGAGATTTRYAIPSGVLMSVYNDNAGTFLDLGCSGLGAPIGSQVPFFQVSAGAFADYSGATGTVQLAGGGTTSYTITPPQTIVFTIDNGSSAQILRVLSESQGAVCVFVVQH
jgi:hypothetical protein